MCPLVENGVGGKIDYRLAIGSISGVVSVQLDILALGVHQHVLTLTEQCVHHV